MDADVERLIGIIDKAHAVRLSADDPVFLLTTIVKTLIEEGRADMAKTVTEVADQISAAAVQAETAATARAERVVTEAGRWAGEQIRAAAERAGQGTWERLEAQVERAERAADRVMVATWIMAGLAVAIGGMTVILLLR